MFNFQTAYGIIWYKISMEKDMFIIKKIGQMNVPEGNCHRKLNFR